MVPAWPLAISKYIDKFSEQIGRYTAWLTVMMVMVTTVIVVLRYGFGIGSIALQESVLYMHSAVFMLGAAYTLKNDGHVRVDIFYRRFGPTTKAWVNCVGVLVFLLPVSGLLLGVSWNYVATAWRIGEVSGDPGGLPLVFLLKTLIPIMALLLIVQGIADLLRNLVQLIYPNAQLTDNQDAHVG